MPSLFSEAEVLRVLQGFNPWWSGRHVSINPFRRAAFTACLKHVKGTRMRTVLLLSGMRGAGKTTLLLQIAHELVTKGDDPRGVLYLSVEHPIFATLPLNEILRIYRSTIHPEPRPAVLLLDEVHYARDWDAQVKELLLDPSDYRILATESVRVVERALVTETQMGRWASVGIPSLSFDEFLRLRGADPVPETEKMPGVADLLTMTQEQLDHLSHRVAPVVDHFRSYLTGGGLPSLAAHDGDATGRRLLHEDIAERALRRDVALHAGPRNLDDLKRLFMYLCVHSGEVFRVQRYANAVGASPSTIASHVALLEQCFLIQRLPPMGPEGHSIEKPRHKTFVADASLRSIQLLEDTDDRGSPEHLRASFVTCLARHAVKRFEENFARIGYWRDSRTLRDLDIIVHGEGRVLVFQFDDATVDPSKSPVAAFCRRTRVTAVFLVSTGGSTRIEVSRNPEFPTLFVRIRASILTYLLGREETARWAAMD